MKFELLRKYDSDIPILQELHEQPAIKKYISISENYFEYVTSAENVWYYKIRLADTIIGAVHLEKDTDTMYLSICTHPLYQAKGYGKKSLQYVLNNLVEDVSRIEVSIEEDNLPSINLFEGCGFVFAGRDGELRNYTKILE